MRYNPNYEHEDEEREFYAREDDARDIPEPDPADINDLSVEEYDELTGRQQEGAKCLT